MRSVCPAPARWGGQKKSDGEESRATLRSMTSFSFIRCLSVLGSVLGLVGCNDYGIVKQPMRGTSTG